MGKDTAPGQLKKEQLKKHGPFDDRNVATHAKMTAVKGKSPEAIRQRLEILLQDVAEDTAAIIAKGDLAFAKESADSFVGNRDIIVKAVVDGE